MNLSEASAVSRRCPRRQYCRERNHYAPGYGGQVHACRSQLKPTCARRLSDGRARAEPVASARTLRVARPDAAAFAAFVLHVHQKQHGAA